MATTHQRDRIAGSGSISPRWCSVLVNVLNGATFAGVVENAERDLA